MGKASFLMSDTDPRLDGLWFDQILMFWSVSSKIHCRDQIWSVIELCYESGKLHHLSIVHNVCICEYNCVYLADFLISNPLFACFRPTVGEICYGEVCYGGRICPLQRNIQCSLRSIPDLRFSPFFKVAIYLWNQYSKNVLFLSTILSGVV